MLRFREEHQLAGVARRLKRGIDAGMNPGLVFSRVQDHVIAAARAHVERLVLEAFVDKLAGLEESENKRALSLLCDLHALSVIEADRAWFMEHGRLTVVRSKAISREVNRLCRRVRPIAVTARRRVRRTSRDAALAGPGRVRRMRAPVGPWADDPLWASVYDWSVEHPRLGRLGWRLVVGSNLSLLYDAVAEIGRLPAGAAVLDVPCGGGVALRGLRPGQGVTYLAADISQAMLDKTLAAARRRGVADQVVPRLADVAALPLADGSVDLVVSFAGLHCFPAPRPAVAEMARVLRSGGVVSGSMIATDTGARYEGVRRLGRRVSMLGDMCSRAELVAWFAEEGVPDLRVTTSGAHGLLPGSEGDEQVPARCPDRRLGARRASRSVLAWCSRAVATRPRRRASRTPGTCCGRPAGGYVTSGGTRRPTTRCRSTARWRGSATSWRPRPRVSPARCSWSASRSARTAPGSPPSAPTRRSG